MRLALIAVLLSLSLLLVAATPAAPIDAAHAADAAAAPVEPVASNVAVKGGVQASPAAAPTASFVRELTDANFEHDTQASTGGTTGDWFVMFAAPWCGHCTQMKVSRQTNCKQTGRLTDWMLICSL